MHRTLEQVLQTLVEGKEQKWCAMLPYAELYMNSTLSSSTGKSPYEAVYRRLAINPFASILSNPDQTIPTVSNFGAQRQELWLEVHSAIEKAKE